MMPNEIVGAGLAPPVISTHLPVGSAMIGIEWVNSANDIPNDLWQECFPPPLEGRWWYSVLEGSELEDQFSFAYGILLRDAQPIGIVPTFIMNVPMAIVAPDALIPLLPFLSKISKIFAYQRTLFVGSPCTDEGTVRPDTGNYAYRNSKTIARCAYKAGAGN